ncbi:hypothetical protein C4552_03685 [Candidatus Parcubacteria bacterium]|nr:MAG: hypothetical protein C4552_03685 [Candidatus Parcubacteria bacterium]
MQTILPHPSDAHHYEADICIIWCFDDRFSPLLGELVARQGWQHVDLIKVAGGAKGLAGQPGETDRVYLLDQIAKSIKLHKPRAIGLMVHADCGAYGSPKFDTSEKEQEFFANELQKASMTVNHLRAAESSQIAIRKFFANFEGLHEF